MNGAGQLHFVGAITFSPIEFNNNCSTQRARENGGDRVKIVERVRVRGRDKMIRMSASSDQT